MIERRRRRATARPSRPAEERGRDDGVRVLPLGGVASLAVSADVVRAQLGAWAGLRAADERPDLDAAWREVLLVLGALVEAGAATLGVESLPPWERAVPVPREPLDLQRRAALSREAVRRATDRAISAELLDLERRVGDELVVRLRPEVFADAPVVAAVDWAAVRDALGPQVSPVALLLVREVARRLTPERRAQGDVVPVSLREFGAATGASKGTIQKALGVLNAAGLVESRTRDRVDSWHRLLPPVFGAPLPTSGAAALPLVAPAPAAPAPVRAAPPIVPASTTDDGTSNGLTPAPSADTSTALAAVGEAITVTVYEVDGIAWPLPPGVQPRLERGADGTLMRRIGNMRLPLRAPGGSGAFPAVEIDGVVWEVLPGAQPQLERAPDGCYWFRIGGERWPFRPQ